MYYMVNEKGEVHGPYPHEWIRVNANKNTLISYQNAWLKLSDHPDFHASSEEMFYILNQHGASEGPYPATWIRANASAATSVSNGNQWLSYRSHPYFKVKNVSPRKELAARSSAWLLSRSLIYVIGGILFATLVLLYTQSYIKSSGMHVQHPQTATSALQMVLTWLNAYLIILVPAYAIGLIFGGHASVVSRAVLDLRGRREPDRPSRESFQLRRSR